MTKFVKPKEAALFIGVSQQRLRDYDRLELIRVIRNDNNNHRLYDLDSWNLTRAMVTVIGMFNELNENEQIIVQKHLKRLSNKHQRKQINNDL